MVLFDFDHVVRLMVDEDGEPRLFWEHGEAERALEGHPHEAFGSVMVLEDA